jgi:phosphoglycolate phosphatase
VARLLLFDIDMTLIVNAGAGREAMATAFRSLFGIADAVDGVSFDGRTDHAIFHEVIERHGIANGDAAAVFRQVAERYLTELPASLAGKPGFLLPGVLPLLDALHGTPAVAGLATGNLRAGAKAKLSHFGLWERFAGGGFGDASPVRADLVFAGIAELAACAGRAPDPGDCIVIGDTPLDIAAAHEAGARALGVATGRYPVEQLLAGGADWALEDLSDTARVVGMLVA